MSFCKKCGANIRWILTKRGRWMPCDPKKRYFAERRDGSDYLITESGELLKGIYGDKKHAEAEGYCPHWVTCPHSDYFREKQKQAERAKQEAQQATKTPPVEPPPVAKPISMYARREEPYEQLNLFQTAKY